LDFDQIESLVDVVKSLTLPTAERDTTNKNSGIIFDNLSGRLTYKNYPVADIFVTRALNLYKSGMTNPLQHFLKFLDNLYQNPSSSVVQRLYQFLEHGSMPTTEDGCFLAYKKVTPEFKDIYTKTIDNSVGAVCTMPRSLVNDNDDQTCSTGLHFCSYEYLSQYGNSSTNTVVIVKINPRDVVSIPTDYNDTKGRCCEYTVVEHLKDYSKPVFDVSTPVVFDPFNSPTENLPQGNIEQEVSVGGWPFADCSGQDLWALSNSQLTKLYNTLEVNYGKGYSHHNIDHVRSKVDGVQKIVRKFTVHQIAEEMKELKFA
jgi:hypothetical protein